MLLASQLCEDVRRGSPGDRSSLCDELLRPTDATSPLRTTAHNCAPVAS